MGPKIEDDAIKSSLKDTIMQAALPYNKAEYQKVEEKEIKADSSTATTVVPSTSDLLEEVDPLRVSTRARFSYELDRYSKNAMLIFEGNATDLGFDNNTEEETESPSEDNICTKFKKTFEKFRFEVDIYRNLTDEEISSTCERFFQRDFTEYGCVAVMMLTKTRDGIVESSHTPNTEFGVMRYMSDLMPPSLQDKPKIYIVQTGGYYVIPRARVLPTLPQDNLEFRLPPPIESAVDASGKRSKICCLLENVHRNIDRLADQTDLHTILHDSVNEFCLQVRCWPIYDLPVGFYSSLTKELRLAKTLES